MPAGLIEEDDRMRARSDLGCDFLKMQLHGLAVAGRQHEGGAGPAFGTYGTEQIGGLVLLAHPHLVLAPHLYPCAGRKPRPDFRHAGRKVFLNASMASSFCL